MPLHQRSTRHTAPSSPSRFAGIGALAFGAAAVGAAGFAVLHIAAADAAPVPPAPVRTVPPAPVGAPPPNWTGGAPNAPESGGAPSGRKTHRVDVHAHDYTDVAATGIRTLRGNVIIASEGTTLRTDLAQYNSKTSVAVAPGKLSIEDDRDTIVASHGTAYYRTRDAILLGSVQITVRPRTSGTTAPEGSPRREFREPVTIYCDRLDYNWHTHIGVATGNLVLKQVTSQGVTRTVTAEKLVYESVPEKVTLTGHVHAVDSKGQQLDGPIAVAILKDGAEEFHMEKGVTSVLQVDSEDEDTPSPSPAPATTPAPKASGGAPPLDRGAPAGSGGGPSRTLPPPTP